MTDASQPMQLPPLGNGPEYVDRQIWLPQLVALAIAGGSMVIRDRTFTRCRLEGPAVILASGGVNFDGCDMGYAGGDIRNLLLRPMGPEKVIGTIAFENCAFHQCTFFAVGFTGSPAFIDNFLQVLGSPKT